MWLTSVGTPGQTPPKVDPEPIVVEEPVRREKVSYSREVAELLEGKCIGCHGSVLAEKGLNLESVAGHAEGRRAGRRSCGKADSSLMFKMAAHRIEPVMPPKDKPANKPMTPLELGLLQMWINQGATDDSEAWSSPRNEAPKAIVLGDLPPGVQPINSVDMTARRAAVSPRVGQMSCRFTTSTPDSRSFHWEATRT